MADKVEVSFADAARVELAEGMVLIVSPKGDDVWSVDHCDQVAAAVRQAFRDAPGRVLVFGFPVSLITASEAEAEAIARRRALAAAPAAGEA